MQVDVPSVTTPRAGIDERAFDPLPPIERLGRLRGDLLAAPYALCTQKAESLGEYLEGRSRSAFARALQRARWRAYRWALGRASSGGARPLWVRPLDTVLRGVDRLLDGAHREPWIVELARALAYGLERAPLAVHRGELIVGNLTSVRLGAALHPDYSGHLLAPELRGLSTRAVNPLQVTPEQIAALDERVFPFCFARSVLSRALLAQSTPRLAERLLDGRAFVLTQFSGISHLTPDYPSVARRGLSSIAAAIGRELQRFEATTPSKRQRLGTSTENEDGRGSPGQEQRAFLRAALIACEGAIAHARRWSRWLALLAERATSEGRRTELRELSQICRRVPEFGARTFHEALQSVWLTHAMLHHESFQHGISFGRLDQYLYPYYRADLEAGRLTRARAVELVGCFLGKAAEGLPLFFERATEFFSGMSSASGITIGGTTPSGEDATNELSVLILRAYDQMRLRQPNIHARFHRSSDPRFRALCYQTLARGGGIPALFNDAVVVPSLMAHGVAPRDAADYSIVGCAEWGVPYRSFPAAGAAFVNVPFALLLALGDGLVAGRREAPARGEAEPSSFDELLARFRERLRDLIAEVVAANNEIEAAHRSIRPTPFLSAVVGGCVERRRDVTAGGARYNSSGIQAVGLADCADSLAVVEQLVFRERRLSLGELMRIVDANFVGHEALHREIRNRIPKYGENSERSDQLARWTVRLVDEVVSAFRNPRGGRYLAGFWSMTTHQGFGRRLGALPSGRLAAEPLANGISPTNGWDRRGPTASLLSAAAIEPRHIANGCVLNQSLDPRFIADEAGQRVVDGLVRGYFAAGGAQLQLNVVDPAVLIDAKRFPERHRGLVVRISGYSAYFNDLTEAMKDELIGRTLHDCSCGVGG
ncbi:MAG: hypothetical protein KC609_18735 [Myxococcales bacterium]|nr:hypothetical protein [Myxococcales bacterium]